MPRRRWLPLTVLVAAVVTLIASLAWVSDTGGGWGSGSMRAIGMTGPATAIAGAGPVEDLDAARRAASGLAEPWGLETGEVMEFDNGFYVELSDPSGDLATEVLVDPRTGSAQIEFGPAMMWNTAYGVHRSRITTPTIGPEQARTVADEWLAQNRPGEAAAEPEEFPGYFTLHTLVGDQVVGMLSVHAGSGAVWYHSWHGRFVAMDESGSGASDR